MKHKLFIIVLTHVLAGGGDAYFTDHNLAGYRGVEHNPVARVFTSNRPANAAWSAAGFTLALWGEHELRKHHHEKLADATAGLYCGGHAYGAAASAANIKY